MQCHVRPSLVQAHSLQALDEVLDNGHAVVSDHTFGVELDALNVGHFLVLHSHDGAVLSPSQNLKLVLWEALLLYHQAVVSGSVEGTIMKERGGWLGFR